MTPSSHRPLVLVVDDDVDTRELYRLVLESVGYGVEDAPTVAVAAAKLSRLVPDVVLSDWLLPDGNGVDVCSAVRMRAATRSVPVVAVTGVTLTDDALEGAEDEGVVAVLLKPADPDAILAGIREALMTGLGRRLRIAAARAKRYAGKVQRRARIAHAGAAGTRADAETLLQRAAARSGQAVTLMIADDSARYVAASSAARELTGYDSSELTALSVWDLTPLPDTSAGQGLWRDFIASGVQEGHYLLRRRDGDAVEARYVALANIAPGWHLSAIAAAPTMPVTLAGD